MQHEGAKQCNSMQTPSKAGCVLYTFDETAAHAEPTDVWWVWCQSVHSNGCDLAVQERVSNHGDEFSSGGIGFTSAQGLRPFLMVTSDVTWSFAVSKEAWRLSEFLEVLDKLKGALCSALCA